MAAGVLSCKSEVALICAGEAANQERESSKHDGIERMNAFVQSFLIRVTCHLLIF